MSSGAFTLSGRSLPGMRLLSTGLRMGSMGVRLIGLIVLARFMTPQDYGEFAFVVVFGAFVGFAIGAEIYTRTIFKISNQPVDRWGTAVSRQYTAVTRIVFVSWMVALGVWLAGGGSPAIWIMAIATVDILNLENNRILVVSKNHVYSAGALFLRQVLWLTASLAFLFAGIFNDPIHAVLSAWVMAGLVSATFSMVRLHRLGLRLRRVRLPVTLMVKMLAASSMMLMSGFAVRGLISLDKIVLGLTDPHGIFAAYAFYATLAFALVPIMENAVFIYLMPDLVSAAKHKNWTKFLQLMRQAAVLVGGLGGIYAVVIVAFADFIVGWIGQPYYSENMAVLYFLMGASILYVLAMVGYYCVYALRQNRRLFMNNAVALVLCHTVYASLWIVHVPLAMPIAMLVAMTVLMAAHFSVFLRVFARERGTT